MVLKHPWLIPASFLGSMGEYLDVQMFYEDFDFSHSCLSLFMQGIQKTKLPLPSS